MLLENIHIDNALKFEHSEVINSIVNDNNAVGATTSLTLRALTFSPSDTNSIFVSKSGSDLTGNGTLINPFSTIKHAVSQCTAIKTYVVINDSGLYYENPISISAYDNCVGIVANSGCSPVVSLNNTLDDFKFCKDITSGILFTQATAGLNQKVISVGAYDGYWYVSFARPLVLNDGTIALMYLKYHQNGSTSNDYELHYRLYDTTFTIIILDVLIHSLTLTWGSTYPYFNLGYDSSECNCATDDYYILTGDQRDGNFNYSSYMIIVNNKTGAKISFTNDVKFKDPRSIKENLFIVDRRSADNSQGNRTLYEIISSAVQRGSWTNTETSYTWVNEFYKDSNYLYLFSLGTTRSIIKINLSTYTYTSRTMTAPLTSISRQTKGILYNDEYFVVDTQDAKIWKVTDFDTFGFTTGDDWTGSISDSIGALGNVNYELPLTKISDSKYLFYGNTTSGASDAIMAVLDFSKFNTSGFVHDKINISTMSNYGQMGLLIPLKNNKFTGKNLNGYLGPTTNPLILTELFETTFINTAKAFLIDGVIFDAKVNGNLKDYIRTSSSITLRYCSILNAYIENSGIKFSSYALRASNDNVIIQNSLINTVDKGFLITGNTVMFKYNIITGCKNSVSLSLTGSGSSVIINNNTFHNNQSGVELISNAGTEIIKNNIFFNNTIFGVKVATALSIINSCCSDPLLIATLGASSNSNNPLFKNNGFINSNLMNLHLQSNYEGYVVNSPALLIGDDGYDAGCYNTTATVSPPSYTSFYIPKPKKIGITIIPVGEVLNTMQDGSVDNRVDAFQLQVDFEWDSITEMYVKDIVKMIMAGGEVRIYFSPYSDESMFESMHLRYKDFPFSNDLYSLSEYGYKDIKLSYVRKLEIEELND